MEFILGIIVLALAVWAIVNILGSNASALSKILWTIGVIILPVIGVIAWYFVGPKSGTRSVA